MTDFLRDYWQGIAGFIGALAWLLRLESRGLNNEREIRRLWEQRKEDMTRIEKRDDEIKRMLEEMRTDIKSLIAGRK